jgi:hypothetical protein
MSCDVLRHSVAERPVLLLDLHQAYEDVLRPHVELEVQALRDALVEGLLRLDAAVSTIAR